MREYTPVSSPAQKSSFINEGVDRQRRKKAFTSNHRLEVGGAPSIPRHARHHVKFIMPPFNLILLFKTKLRVEELK